MISALISRVGLAWYLLATGGGGHLLILGGGPRPTEVMARMVELAGGPSAHILVIPTASADPLEVGPAQVEEFRSLGATASWMLVTPENADHDTVLQALNAATGVFFSGGDQRRLAVLRETRFLEGLRALLARGGVVAGTSAGAAVMSEVMITGDERREGPPEEAFSTIEANNVVTEPGFGLITQAIIDQHFVKRKRHNRLMSLVLEHPHLLGVGIDEGTAVLVGPQGTMEVLGSSCVVVYDADQGAVVSRTPDGGLEARGLVVHVLRAGSSFDLNARCPIP